MLLFVFLKQYGLIRNDFDICVDVQCLIGVNDFQTINICVTREINFFN